jgi:hypothetical protein
MQRYDGFCRWVAAQDAATQLAELANLVRIETSNKTLRQWTSELYRELDQGAAFANKVRSGMPTNFFFFFLTDILTFFLCSLG